MRPAALLLLASLGCLAPPKEVRRQPVDAGPADAGAADAGAADAGADAGSGSVSACYLIGNLNRLLFTKADPARALCAQLVLVQPPNQRGWGIATPLDHDWSVEGGARWASDAGCAGPRPAALAPLASGTGAVTARFSDAGEPLDWSLHVVLAFADAGPEPLDADQLEPESSCP